MHRKCQYSHKSIQVTKPTLLELYNREANKNQPQSFGYLKNLTDRTSTNQILQASFLLVVNIIKTNTFKGTIKLNTFNSLFTHQLHAPVP